MIGDEMNYPGGIKKIEKTIINETNYSNRGMILENELNISNEYYASIDKAYIYKKPTPVKITKVDYPSRDKAVIKQAFFTVPSTTDYNGLYKGRYIDFEEKKTKRANVRILRLPQSQIQTPKDLNGQRNRATVKMLHIFLPPRKCWTAKL